MYTRRRAKYAILALLILPFTGIYFYASPVIEAGAQEYEGNTLRIVGQSGLATLDPHHAGEASTIALLANFYETLVMRDENLAFRPALAERWEWREPRRWRFFLRRNVRFHDGAAFDADDVVNSYARSISDGSRIVTRMAGIDRIEKVDDHIIDIVTTQPSPLLLNQLDAWLIVGEDVTLPPGDPGAVTSLTLNGTGPFMLTGYDLDVGMQAIPHTRWWRESGHDLDRVDYRIASTSAARLAAVTVDEADIVFPVPVQDIAGLDAVDGIEIISFNEPRAIFLGLIQQRPDGAMTPLADERVRRAVAHAIDIDTIVSVILRGYGAPLSALVAREVAGYPHDLSRRAHDTDLARSLLAEAGYRDTATALTLPLDCPNDRYVNDEAICTAISGMLGQAGIDVTLRVEPGAMITQRLFVGQEADPGIFLVGWQPSSLDSGRVLVDLVAGRNPDQRLGAANITGFSDGDLNTLIEAIQVEPDAGERDRMMQDAWRRVHDRALYVPLHQQQTAAAVRAGVSITTRADGFFLWNGIRMDGGANP